MAIAQKVLWVSTPDKLRDLGDAKTPKEVYDYVSLLEPGGDMTSYGWVRVGEAMVEMELDLNTAYENALAAIDLAEKKLRADTEAKLTALLDLRAQFLALPFNGGMENV